jgi:uncharacterized membrane protein YtjA (UPF0391 family)
LILPAHGKRVAHERAADFTIKGAINRNAAANTRGIVFAPTSEAKPKGFWPQVRKEHSMLRLALIFLIIGLIAGALGVYPIAGIASEIAWLLFVVFMVLFAISLIFGGSSWRSGPPV